MDWRKEYSVGVDQFDIDHKTIFDMISRLEAASTNLSSPELQEELFETLMEYTDDHFEREEQFMREVGYAGLVEHHGLHAEVDEELHRLYRKFRDGDEGIARDVVEFLREWWFVHILQVDMAYNPTK